MDRTMPPNHVPPAITLKAFSCPVCGALADQTWFEVHADVTRGSQPPFIVTAEKLAEIKDGDALKKLEDQEQLSRMIALFEREATGDPFLYRMQQSSYDDYELSNIHVSRCFSCGDVTIWRFNTILYPPARYEIEPNADMNDEIRADFNEARDVLDKSPRSAAALLRLCIQKICIQLALPGKNINDDIATLVTRGLDARIQKALDIVRVVGNNAVHPGELDLKDDRSTATKLFELVNQIAFGLITHPKQVDALFDATISDGKNVAIAKRDTPKTPGSNGWHLQLATVSASTP